MNETPSLPGMSLVMTCYNTGSYAEDAIISCLQQKYAGPLQFVLVNDASTDNTAEVIAATVAKHGQGHDIELVDLPVNMGVAGATDAGWARAKYDWIIMIDGDDIQLPERCSRTAELIARYPEARMITLSARKFCSDGDLDIQSYCTGDYNTAPEEMLLTTPGERADNYLHRGVSHRVNGFGCSMAFHRSLYEQWGPLLKDEAEGARPWQDVIWEMRAALLTPMLGSRQLACRYRMHNNNIMNRQQSNGYCGIVEAELFFTKMMKARSITNKHQLLDLQRARQEQLTNWRNEDLDELQDFVERKLNGSLACGNWWQASLAEKIKRIFRYRKTADRHVLRWGLPRLLPLPVFAALCKLRLIKR